MTEFKSEVKAVPYTDSMVYSVLSDLRNLEKIRDKIPQDKIEDFSFDKDSCTVHINPVGKVKFNITDRQPDSTIKFEAEQVPFAVNLWILLSPSEEQTTELTLKVEADLNIFIKSMVSSPLQGAIDKIADMMATIPYDLITPLHEEGI